MPYVIVQDRMGEIDRTSLGDKPVVIGRSVDADLTVKDIVLSRRHCQIEQIDGVWTVTDLGSKNGTTVDKIPVIERTELKDGQTIRAGRVKFVFYAGDIADAPPAPPKRERPADPTESAMAGTVAGFEYKPPPEESAEEQIKERAARIPVPSERKVAATSVPSPKPRAAVIEEREQMFDILSAVEMIPPDIMGDGVPTAIDPGAVARPKLPTPKPRPMAPPSVTLEIPSDLSRGSRLWRGLRSTVKRAWGKMTGWSSSAKTHPDPPGHAPEPSRSFS
jgi:predicted component of type VI protein secretion system